RAARSTRTGRRSRAACGATSPRRLVADAIAEPADRLDERRAELAPQPRDEDLHRVRIAVGVLRVNVLAQLRLRDDAAAVVHQVRQHAEFVARELAGLPRPRYAGRERC